MLPADVGNASCNVLDHVLSLSGVAQLQKNVVWWVVIDGILWQRIISVIYYPYKILLVASWAIEHLYGTRGTSHVLYNPTPEFILLIVYNLYYIWVRIVCIELYKSNCVPVCCLILSTSVFHEKWNWKCLFDLLLFLSKYSLIRWSCVS